MTKRTSIHAEAAKLIRAELKKHGIPAKVRASTASMMTAVDIHVTDLPPATFAEVRNFCMQFQYGHFDGMFDIYEMSNKRSDLPQVKYVDVHNHFSDDLQSAAWQHAQDTLDPNSFGFTAGDRDPNNVDDMTIVHRILTDPDNRYGFWTSRKPRVRAA